MTRSAAIDKFRHEVSGLWLGIVLDRPNGGELSVRLRAALKEIDRLAGVLADDLSPQPAANGQPAQQRKAAT